jgi:hypothetical protein
VKPLLLPIGVGMVQALGDQSATWVSFPHPRGDGPAYTRSKSIRIATELRPFRLPEEADEELQIA